MNKFFREKTFLLSAIFLIFIVVSGILLFLFWTGGQRNFSFEEKIQAWDVFIRLISGFGVLIGALFTAWKYLDQRERELEQRRNEFRAKMIAEREKVYDEVVFVVGKILSATSLADEDVQVHLRTFWELYWGRMVRYESKEIEAAMVQLGRVINEWEASKNKPDRLGGLSLNLNKAIREDLAKYRPDTEYFLDSSNLKF